MATAPVRSTPIGEPLSTREAISALDNVSDDAPDADEVVEEKDKPEANVDEVDDEQDDASDEDASASDEDGEGEPETENADADDEGDEAEPSEKTTIEPPAYLDAKGKEEFAKLPPKAQEFVASAAKQFQSDYSKKTAEIAEVRKALAARVETLKTVRTEQQARMSKWAKVNWAEQAQKLDPKEYNRQRALYERDARNFRAADQRLKAEQAADDDAHDVAQAEAIKTVAPHLIDGEKGRARREQIMEAVHKAGIPRERARYITAIEMSFVDRALKWDAYQAEKSKKPTVKTKADAKSSGKNIKGAPRTVSSTTQVASVKKNFRSNPSRENAERLLNALPD